MYINKVLYISGSPGAESLFEIEAARLEHDIVSYTFEKHSNCAHKLYHQFLDEKEMYSVNKYIKEAASKLDQFIPNFKKYSGKLIQVKCNMLKNATTLFVVDCMDNTSPLFPKGGSGWAIALADVLKIPYIFFFNEITGMWYQYNKNKYNEISEPNINLCDKYSGTGTRTLTQLGELAIQAIFLI